MMFLIMALLKKRKNIKVVTTAATTSLMGSARKTANTLSWKNRGRIKIRGISRNSLRRQAMAVSAPEVALRRGIGSVIYWMTRDTQPMEGDEKLLVRLHELELDGELLPRDHKMTIEFIGDSLTSGEGLTGPQSASEWRTVFMSGAKNYAAQVCALLDAEGEWISQSGWGIATDWTGDPRHVMPGIYDQVCALQQAGNQPYAFAAHPVAAVVVNLGTNDMSALNSLTLGERPEHERRIAAAVRDFLIHLRQVRPGAPILWVCGMCGDGLNALLERAVADTARALQDGLMAFLPLPACTAEETGSLSHPGEASHRRCAALIAPALKDLIEKAGVL